MNPVYCLKCKQQLTASTAYCPHCGQAQNQPPPDPTPKATAASNLGDAFNRVVAPPPPSVTAAPPPSAPLGAPVLPAGTPLIAEELTNQYTMCHWWLFWGFVSLVGIVTSPLLLIFAIYSVIRKQAIRQRAAELGIDPNEMARAASARFWKTGKIFVIVGIIAFTLGLLAVISLGILQAVISGTRETDGIYTPALIVGAVILVLFLIVRPLRKASVPASIGGGLFVAAFIMLGRGSVPARQPGMKLPVYPNGMPATSSQVLPNTQNYQPNQWRPRTTPKVRSRSNTGVHILSQEEEQALKEAEAWNQQQDLANAVHGAAGTERRVTDYYQRRNTQSSAPGSSSDASYGYSAGPGSAPANYNPYGLRRTDTRARIQRSRGYTRQSGTRTGSYTRR